MGDLAIHLGPRGRALVSSQAERGGEEGGKWGCGGRSEEKNVNEERVSEWTV